MVRQGYRPRWPSGWRRPVGRTPTTGCACKRPTILRKPASIRMRSKCGATNTHCRPLEYFIPAYNNCIGVYLLECSGTQRHAAGRRSLMRVVLDTKILVSAFLVQLGRPAAIYRSWQEEFFTLLTCAKQLDELRATLHKPAIAARVKPHQAGRPVNEAAQAGHRRPREASSGRPPGQ